MEKETKRTKRTKIRAAMRRIGAQFPDQPEAKLMLGIINQAANDLMDEAHKDEAERYLRNAVHAEVCGVEPVWIRETFEKIGIFPKVSNAKLTSPPISTGATEK